MSPTYTIKINVEKKIRKSERLYRIKYFRNPDDWTVF